MAIQFILGRSGTGKTRCCIRAIVDALLEKSEQQLILLVPEQATYQAEQAILADKRISGYSRLNVLSFDRLQFLLLGKNTAMPRLSRIGRQMLIHRILLDNRNKLKLFGAETTLSGLSRQMAQIITELHQYAKTPDDIDGLLNELAKDERRYLTAMKFADIGLIFNEYRASIEGNFIDPDVQLMRICRAVSDSHLTRGAKLWIDGFAGFTSAESAILAELLQAAKDSHVALCLDPASIDLKNPDIEKLDEVGLFNPTERVYCELFEMVKKCRLKLDAPLVLERTHRFSNCSELDHIEHNIFELKAPRITASNRINIISAPNERAEVKYIARQIRQLVYRKGLRYRDIAVIASNIDSYEHYIRAYFESYDVPYFIDKRRSLNHHPIVQLVSSALHAVTNGFKYSDIFTYLKTDLVPADNYEIDLLENYCLEFGISTRDWQSDSPWCFKDRNNHRYDEHQVNDIRTRVARPLLEFKTGLCPAGNPSKQLSAKEFTHYIFNLLDQLDVKATVERWIKQACDNNDIATADEHRQFYNQFLDIFDELVEVFAGQTMKAEDYLAILTSAFSQLTLAFIPPALDQVLVGSIERSRHPDLTAVFLIGATQKLFPAPVASDSILSDEDRIATESVDFTLAATSSQTLIERQYLAYIAFTRPSEFLWISYPSVNDKGGAVPRSQFIGDIESLFENLGAESIANRQTCIDNIHSQDELADLLCDKLGKDCVLPEAVNDGKYKELLDSIYSDKRFTELGSKVLYALNYDNHATLDSVIVKNMFGKYIKSSATRLGTFAACPYQYFAHYTMDLKERKEFKFEPLDLGSFYHRVLDALLKHLNEQRKDFTSVKDSELMKLLREETNKIINTDSFISNFVSRRSYNQFIINTAGKVLEDCVKAIAQMIKTGSFRPKLSEVSFGKSGDSRESLGKYEIELPKGYLLSIDGKIDRLDFAEIGNEIVTLVFDYKRRDKSFNWSQLYHGLDLQLPIYMLAVRNSAKPYTNNVAGAFYMPIETGINKSTFDKLPGRIDSFDHKAKGIFNGDFYKELDKQTDSGWSKFYNFRITSKDQQYGNYSSSGILRPDDFEKVMRHAEKKVLQFVKEILSGKIDVNPYRLGQVSPCSYCKYKSVCRFDWQINDYNILDSQSKSQVLEKAGQHDG